MVLSFARDIFIPLGPAGAELLDDTRSWVDPNGRRLSDRLWLARQADRNAIDAILRGAIASGDDPIRAAKRLEDYLAPAAQLSRYPADHPNPAKRGRVKPFSEQPKGVATRTPRSGMGNYAARRLARTEMTRAFGQATLQAAELNPFVEGVKWNLSGSHPKPDDCDSKAHRGSRGMEPGVYRASEVPQYPSHPNCLCFLSPMTVDDTAGVVAQLRRDFDLGPQPAGLVEVPRPGRMRELVTALFQGARKLLTKEAA